MVKILKHTKNTIKKIKNCVFIKIDASFLIVLILAILLDEVWFYFVYLLSMLMHEFSHLLVAKKLGYHTQKMSLSFFGAKLEGDDDFLISDEIKIVLAGPIFNLLMIIFCYLCFWFEPISYHYLSSVLLANWSLLIFNCLPIFPLDMGRFFLAILSKKKTRPAAVKSMKLFSIFLTSFIFVLFLVSFFFVKNFSFGFMCVNLMSLCLSASKDTSYKRGLFVRKKFDKLKKGLPEKNIYISADTPVYSLFKFIDDSHFVNFIFLSDKLVPVCKMTETEFYKEINMIE